MKRQKDLLNHILKGDRVELVSSKAFQLIKISFLLVLITSVVLFLNFFSPNKLSISSFLAFCLISTLFIGIYAFLYNRLKVASLKGDMIIIRALNNRTYVTSLSSIRRMKTYTFLGIHFTNLNIHLDGRTRKVTLISSVAFFPLSPEKSIRRMMNNQSVAA